MQSAGINLLTFIASNNPTPAYDKPMEDMQGDGSAPDQQFSELLGAPFVQNDPAPFNQSVGIKPLMGRPLLPLDATAQMLAQELTTQGQGVVAPNVASLPQVITPAMAEELLGKIEALIAQLGDKGSRGNSWQKLKDQLAEIRDSDTPKLLEDVAQAIEPSPGELESLGAVVALAETPTDRLQVVDRAIRWLQAALTRSTQKEQPQPKAQEVEAAQGLANPSALSLQALSFRPATAADAPGAADARREAEEAREYIEIIPLANMQTIQLPEWATTIAAPVTANTTVPTGEISAAALADISDATKNLDARIPPLGIRDAVPEIDLPEVTLPKTANTADAQSNAASFAAQLNQNSSAVNAQAVTSKLSAGIANEAAMGKDAAAPLSQVNADIAPTPNTQATGTLTTEAVQPPPAVKDTPILNRAPLTEQVQVAIRSAKDDGLDRITIALEPAELGRVEVKMSVDRQGQTQISFMIDKAETFDALSRDARGLERALQESGIKADTGSMQFNLRQQAQAQLNSNLSGQGQSQQQALLGDSDEAETKVGAISAAPVRHYTVSVRDGVDIHA